MQPFSADAIFKKKKNETKFLTSKVPHNPTRPTVFSPASFCFMQMSQSYSLKFSHLRSCQTLQDKKIALNF